MADTGKGTKVHRGHERGGVKSGALASKQAAGSKQAGLELI